jgi:hypothetical protein
VQVELPSPGDDQPPWARVGVIAAVGFVIGVAWPRLAGLSLGPNPPADARPAAVVSSGSTSRAPGLSAAGAASGALMMVAPTGSAAVGAAAYDETVVVGPVEVQKCRDARGRAPDKCDDIAVDALLQPRLKELSKCPSAIGLSGKLPLGIDLDFKHKTMKVQRPKTKLPRTTVDGVVRCAEQKLTGVSLDDLAHEQVRYSLAYTLSFYPPGKTPDADPLPGDDKAAPSGSGAGAAGAAPEGKVAEIRWNSCQVRESPNGTPTGKLTRGMKVRVLDQKEKWVMVEYADKKQGWVFGEALGM